MANVVKAVIKWEIDMENSVVEPKLDCNELDRYYMSMPDGYIVVKIPYAKSGMDEWDIVYVNQRLADYMQLDRDYMLHNTYGHIFSYKDVTLKELYVNVAYHGVPMETEIYSSVAKKYFGVTAYQFAGGYFACLVKDITQMRLYQAAVSSTLQAYYEVYHVNLAEDYCQMIYPKYWSSDETLSYSKEITRRIFHNIICENPSKDIEKLINAENIKNELKDRDVVEYRYKRQIEKDAYKWCLVSFIVEEREEDIPVCVTMTIRNIEDVLKKEMEQQMLIEEALAQAESASRAKGEFLSNMSHEIRTPMNVILGYTSIAKNNMDNIVKVEDCINKIKTAGNHLVRLINEILDVSRIESGNVSIEKDESDICELMDNFYNILVIQSSGKKQQLSMDKDIKHIYVYMDWMRINQVLINIVGNAIKYTPEGGHIHINVKEVEKPDKSYSDYVFTVKDDGRGIAKKDIQHLFDMYTRGAYDSDASVEGTGLGLSIAKRIVELMNGTIEVESDMGLGTEFTITIPMKYIIKNTNTKLRENVLNGNIHSKENIQDSGVSYQEDDSEDTTGRILSSIRIMVVDDNEYNRDIATEILRESGADVTEYSNGLDAIEYIKSATEDAVDIVLMDVRMPGMDGFETTKIIRSLDNTKKAGIPIVAMTANAFDEDRKKALENGMNGHISKPFNVDTFAETVLGYIGERMNSSKTE